MRRVVLAGVLGASAQAQDVVVTASAATTLIASYNLSATTLPAGTDLTPGVTVSRSVTSPSELVSVRAQFTLDRSVPRRSVFRVREVIDARLTTFPASARGQLGSHDTLLRLDAAVATTARVEIGFGSVSGQFGTAQVDVGDDGTFEFTATAAPQSLVVAMPLAAGTNWIRTRTMMFGATVHPPQASFLDLDQDLTITVTPANGIAITRRWPQCAGTASLDVAPNWRLGADLHMDGMAMFSGGIGAFVLGFTEAPVVLPFHPGCILYPNPDLTAGFLAPPSGMQDLVLDLRSPALRPVTVFVQGLFLELGLMELHGTAAYRIDVP